MPGRSAFDLSADPAFGPRRWIVPGLLPERTWHIVAAEAKAGKTYLAMYLAREVATGGNFLGRQVTAARPVLYVFVEGDEHDVALRWRMLGLPGPPDDSAGAGGAGVGLVAQLRASWRLECFFGRQGIAEAFAAAETLARHGHAGLMVVDTLARWVAAEGVNEGVNAELALFCERTEEFVKRTGWALITPHHYLKNAPRMRGGGQLEGGCMGWHNVTRLRDGRFAVDVRRREGPDLEYGYRVHVTRRSMYAGGEREILEHLPCEVERGDAGRGRREGQHRASPVEGARRRVLEFLLGLSPPAEFDAVGYYQGNRDEILSHVEGSRSAAREAFRELLAEGLVEGGNGTSGRYRAAPHLRTNGSNGHTQYPIANAPPPSAPAALPTGSSAIE